MPSAFDRSTLRLRSDELQDGQLTITIYGGNVNRQAFLLYNTHSLPLPSIPAAVPPPFGEIRTFDTTGPSLTIDYDDKIPDVPDTPLSRQVMIDDIPVSAVQPNHDVPDIWNAPFFFEDNRHVFLATTVEQPVWIRTVQDYGILITPGVLQAAQIPPLVVQPPPPPRPNFWDGAIASDGGAVAPARMQRFITEDVYIRQGLGTTLNVQYGDRQIGPSGAISTGIVKK